MSYYTDDMQGKSIEERKRMHREYERQEYARQKEQHLYEDDKYEKACRERNGISWLPLIIGIFISVITFCCGAWLGAIGIFMLSLLITAVSSTVASAKNVSDAKYYNLSKASNKRIQKETINRNAGIAGLAGGTIATGRHAKKAIKELSDPDTWNEMK